jgi:16S rRNA (adenine1518-N6/adenine1519-N6)-dimethyltransferase
MTAPPRLDPAAVRRTLREAGLRPRHGLSQNFLADVDVLDAILAEAAPPPGRRILEIGPGLGILTGGLLAAGAAVTAVELDRGLAARLRAQYADAVALGDGDGRGIGSRDPVAGDPVAGSLRLIEGDALDQDLTGLLAPPYDVVANLPYHITSPILHILLGSQSPPQRAVLMVQREVAERIAAAPGAMSYLSVFVQYHADVRIAFRVAPESFEPEPAVESAVVVIEPHAPEPGVLAAADEDELWRLVQAAFRERRKMLHNVLVRQLALPAVHVDAALAAAGIGADRRPQTLAVAEWLALRQALGAIAPDRRGRSSDRRHRAAGEGHGTGRDQAIEQR